MIRRLLPMLLLFVAVPASAAPVHCAALLPFGTPMMGPWQVTLDAPATAPADDDPVESLLDRLEASAADLDSFTANVYYRVYDDFLERIEIRTGELVYKEGPAENQRRFAVLFDRLLVGTVGDAHMRRLDRQKHYVFDGQWLAEVDHAQKKFLKHQVVPPGKQLNPLKLGEGPFPIPVGQPKAEVRRRFEVGALEPPTEGPLKKVAEKFQVEGLRLVPKPGTREADDYAHVDLLYDRETLLPVGMELVMLNGNRKSVRLTNPTRNQPLDAAAEARLDITDPDPQQWAVTIREWQGR